MVTDLSEQFGQVYDQYIEKIYRFVYLKVNSRETAEDITSKVFLKGWETYQKSQGSPSVGRESNPKIQNIGAFLYQIARNAVTDHYREKGRTKIVSAEVSPQTAQFGNDIQEMAVLSSDFEQVKLALQGLKKDYQDVIIWHYIDGMGIPEIAEIMEKPAGTVRVMLHRGLKELKGVIKS